MSALSQIPGIGPAVTAAIAAGPNTNPERPDLSKPLINWKDSLSSVDVLTHPEASQIIAKQLQEQVKQPQVRDLSEAVVDIKIQTAIQGASILEVHIIDPYLLLLDDGNGNRFIDIDDGGLLVPLEVNYPPGSDCKWWLAACEPSLDPAQANLVLTFEDKIIAQMRDLGNQPGQPPITNHLGETRAQFIARLVSQVKGARFVSPSWEQEQAALTKLGLNAAQISALNPMNPTLNPTPSSVQPGASPQRKNPTKAPGVNVSAPARPKPGTVANVPGASTAVGGAISLLGSLPPGFINLSPFG